MTIYADKYLLPSKKRYYCFLLVCVWIFGLLIGICLYKPFSFTLMCSTVSQPVSIVGLFAIIFLPLIFSYFSFLMNKPIIILIVCFIKAVAFGFSGILISQTYASASWLVRLLFLFSDCCCVLVLFVLWFRYIHNSCKYRVSDISVSFIVGYMIAITDFIVISPFLKGLF